MLVFATRKNIELLSGCPCWFVDNTFKDVLWIFTQHFTILGAVEQDARTANQSILALPFVFALLSNKDEKLYTSRFPKLLKL